MGLQLRMERLVGHGWERRERGGAVGSGGISGTGGARNVLPERDRLWRKPRRDLDGDVVLPERDRQPRPLAGWRGLPLGAGHGISAGDRNLDRQRRRDVLGQHDHHRATSSSRLAPSCLVISSTQTSCDGAASIIRRLGYSSLTCTSRGGRRVHLLGDRPADRGAGVGLRRADDERQLHALGQSGHDHRRRRATRSTTTASRRTR